MNSSTCPKCYHADMIQKVSAIIDEQTHEIYGSSLARKLALPGKPELPEKPNNGFAGILVIIGAVVALLVSFPCLALGVFLLGTVILAPFSNQPPFDTWSMPVRIMTSVAGILTGVVALVVVVILAIIVFRNMSASPRIVAEAYELDLARVKAEILKWEDAKKRWDQLYYCRRDDIVFIPGENTWASTDEMTAYLYR